MSLTVPVAEIVSGSTDPIVGAHPSWERVPLAEVAAITNGFPFKSGLFNGSEGMPLVRIRNVTSGTTDTFTTEAYAEEYVVRHDDLLIGMDGDFNCARWRGPLALLNQRVCKVEVTSRHYDARFLEYALPGYLNEINRHTSSVTVKHLSSKSVQEIPLPLPPLAEQRRIVEKAEELLSDVDAGVAELEATRHRLRRYRQAVLKAAVEGALTAEWREQHRGAVEPAEALLARVLAERRARWEAEQRAKYETQGKKAPKNWRDRYAEPEAPDTSDLDELPGAWVWASPDQLAAAEDYALAIGPFGSNLKVSDYRDSGVPLVFVRNIRRGEYGVGAKYVNEEKAAELRAHRVLPGDILITKMGDPPGDADLYPAHRPAAIITADCIKWTLSPLLDAPGYFVTATNSAVLRDQFQRITLGVAQQKVSLGRFKTLAYPIPPAAEQAAIMEEVERRLSVVDAVAAEVEVALARAGRLRQSVLRRAFEGKLVPQDPADEPAATLLERIREAKRTAGPKRRRQAAPSNQLSFTIESVDR